MKQFIAILLCSVLSFSVCYAKDNKKKKETVKFFVEAMHCNDCIKKIEKNIAFERGVTDLQCDLETHIATVTYRADKTTVDKLVEAFRKIKMDAVEVKDEAAEEKK
ncbi:MAG: heavy-metal-associated domain-containing protein [Parabacteroides sp.]|nr:heavy-metal-associated domain-containing protein [Parabacteroides sp.]